MTNIVTTRIIKIGNSQGIRLPKLLLEQVGLSGEVQVEVENNCLILRAVTGLRQGWNEQFERMAEHGDDKLLDAEPFLLTAWEETHWQW